MKRVTWVLPPCNDRMLIAVRRWARKLRELGGSDATYVGHREAGTAQVHEWSEAGSGATVLRLVDDPGFALAYLEIEVPLSGEAVDALRAALGSDGPRDPQELLVHAQSNLDNPSALAAAALGWRDVDNSQARAPIERALQNLPSEDWHGALMAALLLADPALLPALAQAQGSLPEGPLRDGVGWLIAALKRAEASRPDH